MQEYYLEQWRNCIKKHNKLYHDIMGYIIRGEEPPKDICLEYIDNNDQTEEYAQILKTYGIQVRTKIAF